MPGAHSASTWDLCHERDWPYAFLSYFGAGAAEAAMDRFWARADAFGRDRNPYRASFLQLVAVAETDERAEAEYGPHLEYFYKKLLHFPPPYFTPPGYIEYPSQVGAFKAMLASPPPDLKALTARDMIDRGFAVVGSPATVRDRLEAIARRLGVGPPARDHAVRVDAARVGRGQHPAHRVGRPSAPAHDLGGGGLGEPSAGPPARRRGAARRPPVPLRHCDFQAKVRVAGDRAALVFLHPAGGPGWDPFLDALAERHTVYAPTSPGRATRRATRSTGSPASGTSS